MEKTTLKAIKVIVGAVLFLLALGWAGSSDYEDAVVTEMKDNGTYWKLSERYPAKSDAELVKMYTSKK